MREQRLYGRQRERASVHVHVVRMIAIAWMLTGLGCAQFAVQLVGDVVAAPFKYQPSDPYDIDTINRRAQSAPASPYTETLGAEVHETGRLDSARIAEAVANVKPQVTACLGHPPAPGQVLVSVKVAADGHVTDVTMKNVPVPGLGDCIATAIQKATFPKTKYSLVAINAAGG